MSVNYVKLSNSDIDCTDEKMVKIAINKSLLKEFKTKEDNRVVYLHDGDEFQINIFNPFDYEIAASISIDGEFLGAQIVIRPGERIWLDRNLLDTRKFKFETYEVKNNSSAKQAIRNNGLIEVKIYKKLRVNWNDWNPISIPVIPAYPLPTKPEPYITWTTGHKPTYYENTIYCGGYVNPTKSENVYTNYCSTINVDSVSCDNAVNTSCSTAVPINATLTANAPDGFYYTGSSSCSATTISVDELKESLRCKDNNSIKTGRVGKSKSQSDIDFEETNIDFEVFPYSVEKIRILPIEMKQVNADDLKKIYCTNCGRKIKQNHKYCPYCGAKQ